MSKIRLFSAGLLTATFAVVSAAPSPIAQEASQEGGQETAAAPAPAPADDRVINRILVKVNGTPIFLSEMETELESQLVVLRNQFPEAEIEAQLPDLRRRMLAGMIDDTMMMQRADQLQITADANSVDRALQNLREANSLTTDAEFAAALETMGITLDQLREQMRKRIRQQQLAFQEVQRGVFVSESEIDRYYRENPGEFEAPERVQLEQLIFVGGNDLEAQARAALQELRGGAPLAEVAASYPQASSFPADGSFVSVVDLQESLAAAIPDLPVGSFSDPIRSQFGWHLVRVVERQARAVQAIDDVRDAIRQRLTLEKSNARMIEYLGQLRDQTYIEILAPEFADIEEFWRSDESADQTASRD